MKRFLQIIIGLFITMQAFGQQDPMYSQYMFNCLAVNPAYAGSREVLSTTALYRRQWVGIKGAPSTFTFSADMPVKNKKIGLGINVTDDRLGIMHNTLVNISYAYRIRINDKGILAMGLQGVLNQYKADYASVDPSQNSSYRSDVAFASNVSRFFPNVGFGLWYSTDRFYAGVSAPKLIKNKLTDFDMAMDLSSYKDRQSRHFFITAGYVFPLNDVMKLKPSALLKMVHGSPIELDVNANLWFHDRVSFGLSYRTGDSMDVLLEFQATPQFRFGYAYDYTLTRLQNFNSGSHEIMVRYEFGFDKGKILSPRYF